jgi:branched-chain amino acid aminotransferase
MELGADPGVIVYFKNQFVAIGDARVNILTHALHYGTGVFEGIRGYWDDAGQELFLFRTPEHYQRWKKNCGILRIKVPPTAEMLCDITAELIQRNRFRSDLYIRPLAYKSAERIGLMPNDEDAFAIMALPLGEYLPSQQGLHVCIASWRRIDDNAIPARGKICGAYVNSVLASDEARRNGFDEAIFLNESGHVAEGVTHNVFMVRNGSLITPPGSENILEGITRDSIIELARRELRLEVVERPIDRSELYVCDELFFTGTAVEIAPIVRLDHRPVGPATVGKIAGELRRLYFEATHGRLAAYRKWLSPTYHSSAAAV